MRLGQEHLERSLENLRGVSVCWESAAGFRTTFSGYLHLALNIQDQMLVVNDSCNMSWVDGNRPSSKDSGPYTSEHLTLSRQRKQYKSPHLVILDELS
jgi:hypothetical protein